MIQKTRGIVISYIKYQESSIIVRIFTEEFGFASFIVNGIRSAKSRRSMGYFQPFSLLDLVVYMKPGREIQRISEYKFFLPTHSISQDIRKSTIVIFLSEVLTKVLQTEPSAHKPLFEFLLQSIIALDELHKGIENFHLHFLLKITPYLGFGIRDGQVLLQSMGMETGKDDELVVKFISGLLHSSLNDPLPASGSLRVKTLELILSYYHHHGVHLGEIKSLKVLSQVFS